MADGEIIGYVYCIIAAISIYGIIGSLIGMAIDVLDNRVMFVCIFLWPIVLPIYLIICLVKIIKEFCN